MLEQLPRGLVCTPNGAHTHDLLHRTSSYLPFYYLNGFCAYQVPVRASEALVIGVKNPAIVHPG